MGFESGPSYDYDADQDASADEQGTDEEVVPRVRSSRRKDPVDLFPAKSPIEDAPPDRESLIQEVVERPRTTREGSSFEIEVPPASPRLAGIIPDTDVVERSKPPRRAASSELLSSPTLPRAEVPDDLPPPIVPPPRYEPRMVEDHQPTLPKAEVELPAPPRGHEDGNADERDLDEAA